MKKLLCVLTVFLCVSSLSLALAANSTVAKAKLRVAYVAPIGVMAPLWAAAETGALKNEGLDVEMVLIDARASIAALVAKEVDVLEISMPGIVAPIVAGGDLTMIAGLLNKMIFSFHANKEIKTAEQLRGKIVGSDRVGTPSDYGSRLSLSLVGLNADTDVKVLRIGGSNILWPALQSGQIAAAALSPPHSFSAEAAGFNRLTTTYHLPYQNVGYAIRGSEVETKADAWVRLLRATREGLKRWYADGKFGRDLLAKYTREKDAEKLQKTYDFFTQQAGFNQDLSISEPGVQQILQFMGSTVLPAAKTATAKQFFDTRILERLGK